MVKLGKTYADLEPYGLYPVHEYFHGERGKGSVAVMPPPKQRSLSEKVPLRKIA
jgi:hypothetical protein